MLQMPDALFVAGQRSGQVELPLFELADHPLECRQRLFETGGAGGGMGGGCRRWGLGRSFLRCRHGFGFGRVARGPPAAPGEPRHGPGGDCRPSRGDYKS
jgi:hypothetical protein